MIDYTKGILAEFDRSQKNSCKFERACVRREKNLVVNSSAREMGVWERVAALQSRGYVKLQGSASEIQTQYKHET